MQHSNDTTQHDHQSLVRKYYRYINIFSGVALIQLPMLLASIFFFATKNFEMKKKPHIRQNIYNETPWNTWACNCNKYNFFKKIIFFISCVYLLHMYWLYNFPFLFVFVNIHIINSIYKAILFHFRQIFISIQIIFVHTIEKYKNSFYI